MSVRVIDRVWANSQQSGGGLLVMLALADFANDDGECWPSVPTLAEKSRLTEREVQYLLPKLEAAGELRLVRSAGGRRKRHRYIVTVAEKGANDSPKELHRKDINGEIWNTETVKPTSPALNHHRTINKKDSVKQASAARRSGSKEPDPRIKQFIDFFATQYQDRFTDKYIFSVKDGALIKRLLGTYSLERLQELAVQFLKSTDEWVKKKGGFTIGVFLSQINKLISTQYRPKKYDVGYPSL